jgi:hypothetical protein
VLNEAHVRDCRYSKSVGGGGVGVTIALGQEAVILFLQLGVNHSHVGEGV